MSHPQNRGLRDSSPESFAGPYPPLIRENPPERWNISSGAASFGARGRASGGTFCRAGPPQTARARALTGESQEISSAHEHGYVDLYRRNSCEWFCIRGSDTGSSHPAVATPVVQIALGSSSQERVFPRKNSGLRLASSPRNAVDLRRERLRPIGRGSSAHRIAPRTAIFRTGCGQSAGTLANVNSRFVPKHQAVSAFPNVSPRASRYRLPAEVHPRRPSAG
jgi:hypothetical protein